MRTVSEVSQLAGVSVRTLHHYDAIGLLSPSARSSAGYRLYSHEDLERLQEIVTWRRLGFSLADLAMLLEDPAHDRTAALHAQRALVERDLARLAATARALDQALAAAGGPTRQEETTMFDRFDPGDHEEEVRERWGQTSAYRESAQRTASYREHDWREIRSEFDAIVARFAALMAVGEPASGDAARATAQQHRDHLERWFYPCSPEMHRGLGELYVADQRFAANFDRHAAGLSVFVHDAIAANAAGEPAAR